MNSKAAGKLFAEYEHSVGRIFNYFKRQAKQEDITAEELVEVAEIEDMNDLSHEIAEDKKEMLMKKMKKMELKKKSLKSKKDKATAAGKKDDSLL